MERFVGWMYRRCMSRWLVVRYDDNGNQVVVFELATEAEAREVASQFEARAHKQLYEVMTLDAFERIRSSAGRR